jgi:hypothetical protein
MHQINNIVLQSSRVSTYYYFFSWVITLMFTEKLQILTYRMKFEKSYPKNISQESLAFSIKWLNPIEGKQQRDSVGGNRKVNESSVHN